MSKVKKDVTTIDRAKLPGLLLGKLSEVVGAWEEGKADQLATLTGQVLDLGVAWEQLQSAKDVNTVLAMPGIGVHADASTDVGKLLVGLKTAVEAKDLAGFKASVLGIDTLFQAQTNAQTNTSESTGASTETQGNQTNSTQTTTQPEANAAGATQTTPNPTTETSTTANPADSATSAATDAGSAGSQQQKSGNKQPFWGLDLALDAQQARETQKKHKAAEEERHRVEKASQIKPEDFNWNQVVGGQFQPK